jgi:CheY-like chemotaxis protein
MVGMDGAHAQASVLLVERDEVRRGDISLALQSVGFVVVAASHVGDAAAVLTGTAEPVAAVVADSDPAPLLGPLRQRNPSLFVVHTRGLILPLPQPRTYCLDRATPPATIARVVRRLYPRPNTELSNT